MLAYILAIAVGLGSLAFYLAAFFFPEVHRKSDFIWGGVGLAYALVLWICARRITGGVLLGQTAAVSLIGWLGWQTLTLRRAKTPASEQTTLSPDIEEKVEGSFLESITSRFRKPESQPVSAENPESVATLVEESDATETEVDSSAEAEGVEDAGETAGTEEAIAEPMEEVAAEIPLEATEDENLEPEETELPADEVDLIPNEIPPTEEE